MSLLTEVLARPERLAALDDPQWDRLLRLARYAKLLGTLEHLTRELQLTARLPSVVQDTLASERQRCAMIDRQIRRELYQLEQVLGPEGRPLVLLKGTAYLIGGLPTAHGRRFNDIDLLVRRQDLPWVEARLLQAGWESDAQLNAYDQRYYREWMHEIPALKHPERGIEVDIHHSLTPPVGRLPITPAKLFEARQPLPGTPFSRLGAEDLLLHSAAHLLFNDELRGGLRDLWDMHLLCGHSCEQRGEEYWFSLERRAQELGLLPPLDLALQNLHRLLETPVPTALLQRAIARSNRRWGNKLLMRLIQTALAPADPDRLPPRWSQELLFIRSHWVRMPPLMLAGHLCRKAVRRLQPAAD